MATAKVPAKVIVPEVVIGPPEVVNPVVPPETATLLTVPLDDAFTVWLGQVPDTVTFVPATIAGVDVPEPPLTIGNMPVTPVVKGNPVALVSGPAKPPGTVRTVPSNVMAEPMIN